MKTINVTFEDDEHETLVRMKGDKSWHEFIMQLADDMGYGLE